MEFGDSDYSTAIELFLSALFLLICFYRFKDKNIVDGKNEIAEGK